MCSTTALINTKVRHFSEVLVYTVLYIESVPEIINQKVSFPVVVSGVKCT